MSTNRAIPFKSPRKPAGAFFHWNAPDVPIAVHFHLNVIDVLEGNAVRAGKKETAGVLLGRIENGQRPTLIIEDSEAISIPTDGSASESPFQSHEVWESVVARWNSKPGKRLSIVGFYRSGGSAGQKTLDDHDLAILQANSTESEKIFLLIEPHVERPTSGFLFMAPEGVEAWTWNEVPFTRSELAKRGTIPESPKVSSEELAARSQSAAIEKIPDTRSGSSGKPDAPTRLQWALGGAAVAAILVALAMPIPP
jgi:hypothetical protein